jgi:hypothetical protein
MFRAIAMVLCGVISYVVVANISLTQVFPLIKGAEARLSPLIEGVGVFNNTGDEYPLSMISNGNYFIPGRRQLGMHTQVLMCIRGYGQIAGHKLFEVIRDHRIWRARDYPYYSKYPNIIGWSRPNIPNSNSSVRQKIFLPMVYTTSFYGDISSQFPLGGTLSEARLVAGSNGCVASRKSSDPGKYQGTDDKPQTNPAHPQLPIRIIGRSFGGSRHALLFAQISLVMILSIAAWGPIYLGIRFLAFGNPRIPSDFILTPRFLIGWGYPRLVGLFTLCCGLLLIGGGGWLTWLLRE